MPIQTAADSISNSQGSPFGFKNRIINGAMVIDQRNAGASVTANDGTFSVDRFKCVATVNGKFSMQQNAGSVTPPVGYSYYLGCTSSSAYSVGAGDFFCIGQQIEGFNFADMAWGTANAKTITLSFQVYSSLTGTFGGTLTNSAGNRSYPFSYTVSSANTWTSISVTVSGDTSGTWVGATNGTAVQVRFGLGAGASYSGTANAWAGTYYNQPTGTVSVVGTNGATFYITGVQLEKGTQATAFDYRDYGRELQLCQRYYEHTYGPFGFGRVNAGATLRFTARWTVRKRATPSISGVGTFTVTDYYANDISQSAAQGISNTSSISEYGSLVGFQNSTLTNTGVFGASQTIFGDITGGSGGYVISNAEL
jgi:hypothetical protein